MNDFTFEGKTVLITGGSQGLGAAFARELAPRGARLVLVARGRERLQQMADGLGKGTLAIAEDLVQPGASKRVFEALSSRGLEVDVLINNAGFATHGPFSASSLDEQRDQIALNVSALVELTHLFLPSLLKRQGGIIQVASTAAFQPVPYMATYAASKAFVLSFSEALWAEYRPHGVRVLALCPGATDTPFFQRAGEGAALGKKARPEDVVELGLKAFRRNRSYVVHGRANFLTAFSARLFPRAMVAKVSARLMRPHAA